MLPRILINAAAFWVAARFVPGIAYTGLPLMLWLTGWLSTELGLGFQVQGLGAAYGQSPALSWLLGPAVAFPAGPSPAPFAARTRYQ